MYVNYGLLLIVYRLRRCRLLPGRRRSGRRASRVGDRLGLLEERPETSNSGGRSAKSVSSQMVPLARRAGNSAPPLSAVKKSGRCGAARRTLAWKTPAAGPILSSKWRQRLPAATARRSSTVLLHRCPHCRLHCQTSSLH